MPGLKVYGADRCGKTRSTLRHLVRLGIKYEYIEVDDNAEASECVKQQNNGNVIAGPSSRHLDESRKAA